MFLLFWLQYCGPIFHFVSHFVAYIAMRNRFALRPRFLTFWYIVVHIFCADHIGFVFGDFIAGGLAEW